MLSQVQSREWKERYKKRGREKDWQRGVRERERKGERERRRRREREREREKGGRQQDAKKDTN